MNGGKLCEMVSGALARHPGRDAARKHLDALAQQQLPPAIATAFLVGWCTGLERDAIAAAWERHGLLAPPPIGGRTGGWLFDWATVHRGHRLRRGSTGTAEGPPMRPPTRGGWQVFDRAGELSQRAVIGRTATWIWQQTGQWPGVTQSTGHSAGHTRPGGPDVALLAAVLAWLVPGPVGLEAIARWVKTLRRAERYLRATGFPCTAARQLALPLTHTVRHDSSARWVVAVDAPLSDPAPPLPVARYLAQLASQS